MSKAITNYWNLRFQGLKEALENNNFEVYLADTKEDAKEITLNAILPTLNAKSISWGGSATFVKTGLYHHLKDSDAYEILDPHNQSLSAEEKLELRRQALLVDLYFTSTNAITESGQLVNLDMVGNRVGAMHFGPKHVVILVGRNKIVSDIHNGMVRTKEFAAPTNVMRLGMNTPCAKTSVCQECQSPDRICNVWTITEKSFPKHRIKIVLINEDLGL